MVGQVNYYSRVIAWHNVDLAAIGLDQWDYDVPQDSQDFLISLGQGGNDNITSAASEESA